MSKEPFDIKNLTIPQLWGSLKKSWKGYKIAKAQKDKAKMVEYATRIQNLQKALKVEVSKFEVLSKK